MEISTLWVDKVDKIVARLSGPMSSIATGKSEREEPNAQKGTCIRTQNYYPPSWVSGSKQPGPALF